MGAGPLCPGQMYSRHDLAKYGFGTGCRGTWTRNSDNSDEMAQSLLKKVGSLEGRAKSRFSLNKQRLEAVEMFEEDARVACAAIGRCESRRAAQAEARGERPSGDLREAPPHVSALASWRAKYKRRR
jgi:hypothetical protein